MGSSRYPPKNWKQIVTTHAMVEAELQRVWRLAILNVIRLGLDQKIESDMLGRVDLVEFLVQHYFYVDPTRYPRSYGWDLQVHA